MSILSVTYGQWRDSARVIIPTPSGKAVKITQFAIGDTNSWKTSGALAYTNSGFYIANGSYYQLMGSTVSTDTATFVTKSSTQVISAPKYFTARQYMTSVAVDTIVERVTGDGVKILTTPSEFDTLFAIHENAYPIFHINAGNGEYRLIETQSNTSFQNVTTVFNDSLNGFWRGRRARGTRTSPSGVIADDILTSIGGLGYHSGGNFASHSQATVVMYAEGTHTNTSRPTYLTLETTAVGDTVKAVALKLASNKQAIFSTNALFQNTSAEIAAVNHNGSITIRGDSTGSTDGAWSVFYGGTHATQAGNRLENANTFSIRNLAGSTTNFIVGTNNGRRWAGLAPSIGGTASGRFAFGDSLYNGATLVMDASRNLLNIGTIGSGTITTSGNYLGSAATTRIAKSASETGVTEISGGLSPTNTGAWLALYGGSHASQAGRLYLNVAQAIFRNPLGTKTNVTIDTTQLNLGTSIDFKMGGTTRIATSTGDATLGTGSFSGKVQTGGLTSVGAFGVANIVDTVNYSAVASSIASKNLTATAGTYRISYNLFTRTAGTGGTAQMTLSFNNGNAQTMTSAAINLNSANSMDDDVFVYTVASGTPTVVVTVTGATGSPTYTFRANVERLQ